MVAPQAHDGTNCPDMAHIREKLSEMSDQMVRLTELMERQVRLEEQSANHGAAVGRAFGQIEVLDKRMDRLEEVESYFRGGVKFTSVIAAVVVALLAWGLKSQLDILQALPVKLDRIERQQAESTKIEDRLASEIASIKELNRAAPH